jgi:hypothetical protein
LVIFLQPREKKVWLTNPTHLKWIVECFLICGQTELTWSFWSVILQDFMFSFILHPVLSCIAFLQAVIPSLFAQKKLN